MHRGEWSRYLAPMNHRMPALIETVRVRQGVAPLWHLHLRRLVASCRSLGIPFPLAFTVPAGGVDRAHRLEVALAGMRVEERPVGGTVPVRLATSGIAHQPYPHKTTERDQFDRVLREAAELGVDDGLLLTSTGRIAECAVWSLFWWEGDTLCAPPLALGVLPGVARMRIGEIHPLLEREAPRSALDRVSIFVANALRGILPVAQLDGRAMAPNAGTARLQQAFWQTGGGAPKP